jgi:FMN phosphatase YigB (HAD superfamily)
MVGDNFDADIRPAATLGLSTAWITPADVPLKRNSGDGVPTVRLTTLSELATVLDS